MAAMMARPRECESDWDYGVHLIAFLQDEPFFAEISRQLMKVLTKDLPTAGVTWDPESDEMVLYINPDFASPLGPWALRGLFTHEFYHLIFNHLSVRRRTPHRLWNIATDLAINSIIMDNAERGEGKPRNAAASRDDGPLPKCGLIPGRCPLHPEGRELTKEEKEAGSLAAIIEKMPKLKSSEWYYYELQKHAQKQMKKGGGKCPDCNGTGKGGSNADGDGKCQTCDGKGKLPPGKGGGLGDGDPFGGDPCDSMDDHGGWDDIPEERREYVEGKVKAIIEKAVRHADSKANGWGSVPADMRCAIRESLSTIIDWRNVLNQFIGSLVRGGRRNSLKRINRRYPYVHPGTTRSYKAKLLVAIDQSGSVGNDMLEMFFGELNNCTRQIEVDILAFDCYADVKDVWTWKKGQRVGPQREKCGGTDFTAPTKVFNDHKNAGRWDGMLIMTDGMAPKPIASRLKRGWILGKGCKMEFKTDELVITLDDESPRQGAWR